MGKRTLQIQQLNSKMQVFGSVQKVAVPSTGWIKAIRVAFGMSLEQLGKKLSITKQSMLAFEERERNGSLTLKALREAGKALDMQLIYGFVPNDGSLETLIDRKAKELATKIVLRTSNTMKLEDQENSKQRVEKAIEERVIEIKDQIPKTLWD